MSCNCRKSLPATPSRMPTAPARPAGACVSLEADGNALNVRFDLTGSLYLAAPYDGSLPVASFVSAGGCSGPFARALVAAQAKLLSVFSNTTHRTRFLELAPHRTLKLGYLRDVLRSF